jgi:hypothetical protein
MPSFLSDGLVAELASLPSEEQQQRLAERLPFLSREEVMLPSERQEQQQ